MMKFLTAFLLLLVLLPMPVFPLTDVDRQELLNHNMLADKNAGFESGIGGGWGATPALVKAATTNILFGKGSVTWDSTAASQTLNSPSVVMPNGLEGRSCEARLLVKVPTGTATHTFQVFSGTDIYSAPIVSSATPYPQRLNFPCPVQGTSIRIRLLSVASNEPLIAIDDAYIGGATNVGSAAYNTEWTPYTPSFTGMGTPTSVMNWRVANGRLELLGYLVLGTTTGAQATMSLPAGFLSAPNLPNPGSSGAMVLGAIGFSAPSASERYVAVAPSASVVGFTTRDGSNNNLVFISGATLGNAGMSMSIDVAIPIAGYGAATTIAANQRLPKVTIYTSGSGTHTVTPGTTRMRVRMVGGAGSGNGGSYGASAPANGVSGNASTFGSSLLIAGGGGGGSTVQGGVGGVPTVNSPAVALIGTMTGNSGGPGTTHEVNASFDYIAAGMGGASCLGGTGSGGNAANAGGAGATNSGSGGGGGGSYGGTGVQATSGGGGGAGACVEAIIDAPAPSYAYSVGASVAGGSPTGGGGAAPGGAGAAGKIEVIEEFNATSALIANNVTSGTLNGSSIAYGTADNGGVTTNCTTSTCSLRNSSNVVSVQRLSTGSYRVNLTPGVFSVFPSCSCSAVSFGVGPTTCIAYSVAANQVLIDTQNPPDKAYFDTGITFTCMGPR